MSTAPVRKRSDRVASLQVDSFSWLATWNRLTQPKPLMRFGMVLVAVAIITLALRGWNPPFPYRQGYVPPRTIVARVPFEIFDQMKTDAQKTLAGREVLCYYENGKQPLVQLRSLLREIILRLAREVKFDELKEDQLNALAQLLPPETSDRAVAPRDALAALKSVLKDNEQIEKLDSVLKFVFDPLEEIGLLESLGHTLEQGNQKAIRVYLPNQANDSVEVDVKRVRIVEVAPTIRENLKREMQTRFGTPESATVANLIFYFLESRLPNTLTWNSTLTQDARWKREEQVKPVMIKYFPSVSPMVTGGTQLGAPEIAVLQAEYDAWLNQQTWFERSIRLIAYLGMLSAICLLCGLYIYFQLDRSLLSDNDRLFRLLALCVSCVLLCAFAAQDPWRAKIMPLVLTAMTATIAYGRSVTLILLTALSLAITLSLGMDIAEFVILLAVSAASTLLLGRIRNRKRLVYVACGAAVVVALTTIGVGTMVGQVNGISQEPEALSVVRNVLTPSNPLPDHSLFLLSELFKEAGRHAMFTVLAGLVMAGLLPFVENIFDVQTDLSLLELGDASHALLRQLAQRAPGTYNHSITVAAIAEAAADSIGANGLLTRVGAYFHDIGKMFKPNYFIENQSEGVNRHDALQPAMSTLVIIAHVKDGADLGRQHHLPKPIIDFIEQHHGTTLVEYFFKQATKKNEESNSGSQVSEATFRYPGPKPQTLEAAVLMIADSVESASRSLVEPTPTRLQNLIESITMKKLTDGQFDECGLTLLQLNIVKTAVLKSLTSIYHHRVKYDEKSA